MRLFKYVGAEAVMGIVRRQGGVGRKVTSGGNSHEWRTQPHEMRQLLRPNRLPTLLALPRAWRARRWRLPWRTPERWRETGVLPIHCGQRRAAEKLRAAAGTKRA